MTKYQCVRLSPVQLQGVNAAEKPPHTFLLFGGNRKKRLPTVKFHGYTEIIEESLLLSEHQPRGPSSNQRRKCSMKDVIKHSL